MKKVVRRTLLFFYHEDVDNIFHRNSADFQQTTRRVCQKTELFVLHLSWNIINLPKKRFSVTGYRKLQEVLERIERLLSFHCYLNTDKQKENFKVYE
jgi:hypothetical protein